MGLHPGRLKKTQDLLSRAAGRESQVLPPPRRIRRRRRRPRARGSTGGGCHSDGERPVGTGIASPPAAAAGVVSGPRKVQGTTLYCLALVALCPSPLVCCFPVKSPTLAPSSNAKAARLRPGPTSWRTRGARDGTTTRRTCAAGCCTFALLQTCCPLLVFDATMERKAAPPSYNNLSLRGEIIFDQSTVDRIVVLSGSKENMDLTHGEDEATTATEVVIKALRHKTEFFSSPFLVERLLAKL